MNNQSPSTCIEIFCAYVCSCLALPETILFLRIAAIKPFPADAMEYFAHV
jgi:hypothetical protein